VLGVEQDEAGWHPVSFRNAPKPSSAFQQSQNHPDTFLADLKPFRFFFSSVKPLLTLLLFCTKSNVNM
jgi:hypothetical protein